MPWGRGPLGALVGAPEEASLSPMLGPEGRCPERSSPLQPLVLRLSLASRVTTEAPKLQQLAAGA